MPGAEELANSGREYRVVSTQAHEYQTSPDEVQRIVVGNLCEVERSQEHCGQSRRNHQRQLG